MELPIAEEWLVLERDVLGTRPLISGSVEFVREVYETTSQQLASLYPPVDAYDVEDIRLETDNGLAIRVYLPTKRGNGPFAVGVFAHGGGHVNGGAWKSSFEDKVCRTICNSLEVVIAQVDFRLAPEHPSPAQVNDCFDAFNWCYANASQLRGDKNRFFSIGSSLGGGVAVGIALKLIDEGLGDRIKGVVAIAPAMLHPDNVPDEFVDLFKSYQETWTGAPLQDGQSMIMFYEHNGAVLQKNNPYVFPCLHKELSRLPPTFQIVCGLDPVRDDAVVLKHVLDKHKVQNQMRMFEGLPHYFWLWPQLPSSEKFHQQVVEAVQWVTDHMPKSEKERIA